MRIEKNNRFSNRSHLFPLSIKTNKSHCCECTMLIFALAKETSSSLAWSRRKIQKTVDMVLRIGRDERRRVCRALCLIKCLTAFGLWSPTRWRISNCTTIRVYYVLCWCLWHFCGGVDFGVV